MREIKFRIWDNLTNEMYYDALVGNCRGESTIPCVYLNDVGWAHTDNCVVEQFTGLLDKNGTEIYEGDTVSAYKDLTEMYSRGSVENGTLEVWEEVVGNIDIPKEIVEYIGSSFRIGEYYLDTIEDCELEVIGNIHDNKELL